MKFYSTSSQLPGFPRSRSLYALEADFCSIKAEPIDHKHFQARAKVADLGPLIIAWVQSNAAVISRKSELPANRQRKRYSFSFVLEGEVIVSHHLGTTELETGDFVLLDNLHPRTLFNYNQVTMLLVTVPEKVMHSLLPRPEELLGRKVSCAGRDNWGVFESVTSAWEQINRGLMQEFSSGIASALLEKVIGAYTKVYANNSTKPGRRVSHVLALVEENLCNPELTVELVAGKLGVSSRYLRSLFADRERLSHYILRRRLEECAHQLSNALYRNVSITSIAFHWGFNSPAHFSRAFKQHFSSNPRDYRKQQLRRSQLTIREKEFLPSDEE